MDILIKKANSLILRIDMTVFCKHRKKTKMINLHFKI